VHKQIENYLKFLALITSKNSLQASEELCSIVNSNYTSKLPRNEKHAIEGAVKEFAATEESGCWYVSSHYFLSSLHNNLAKKVIENAQKNVEIPKNHNYGTLFTEIKHCISVNTVTAATHFSQKIRSQATFEKQLPFLQDFVDVLNIIFIDNRRSIMKKPSFLKDNTLVH
jgi:hypothetical protein